MPAGAPGERPVAAFCGRCALPPSRRGAAAPASRVCEHCGLGLVLQAPAASAPSVRDAFVVVDRWARVCALSGVAETLLAVAEREAVGRPIIQLVVPATDDGGGQAMVAMLRAVARGTQDAGLARGVAAGQTVAIRVGPCWPPRAALLVLEPHHASAPARPRRAPAG